MALGLNGVATKIPMSPRDHDKFMNKPKHQSTRLVHAGNHPERHLGVMNTPTYRTSTVLFPTVASMKEGSKKSFDTFYYGRYGTPTTMALEEAVADLEGG